MSTAPEFAKSTKEKFAVLRTLSEKAENGDKEARRELRRAVRESSPEVISRASDIGRRGQWVLADTIAGGMPLMEEAIVTRLDLMRVEVAGENPTALEVLLTERVVSSWLVVEILEALMNAQLKRGEGVPRASTSYLKFIIGWVDSAHRRHLSSIRELARVRKLQSNVPGIQYNTQINLPTTSDQREEEPHR